jgi:hypothetical protein
MKRILGFLLAFALSQPVLPKAQPHKPTPTPHTNQKAAAPATTTDYCAPGYYRNVEGLCVHRAQSRPRKPQHQKARRRSAGMAHIPSADTGEGCATITEAGCSRL